MHRLPDFGNWRNPGATGAPMAGLLIPFPGKVVYRDVGPGSHPSPAYAGRFPIRHLRRWSDPKPDEACGGGCMTQHAGVLCHATSTAGFVGLGVAPASEMSDRETACVGRGWMAPGPTSR